MKPVLRVLFWVVVVLSLAANAVLFGLWLRSADLRADLSGGVSFRDLPADARAAIRQGFARDRAALADRLRAVGAARRAMIAAAAARPYDRAAVEAAMADLRAAGTALQMATQAVVLRALDETAGR